MQESIYNLVPVEKIVQPQPPRYVSKFDHSDCQLPGSTFGCHGSTLQLGAGHVVKEGGKFFGPPKFEDKKFLKKGEKLSSVPAKLTESGKPFKYSTDRKPTVPRKDERPVMGLKTNKNFITANAVESILAVPKGLEITEPDYLKKADYGKVPGYLPLVKEEIARENEMIDQYVKEQMGLNAPKEKIDEVGVEERQELIDQLKTKWDALNANYQKLTHMTKIESFGLLKRKEILEKELTQLEKDINLLEGRGPLLVRAG